MCADSPKVAAADSSLLVCSAGGWAAPVTDSVVERSGNVQAVMPYPSLSLNGCPSCHSLPPELPNPSPPEGLLPGGGTQLDRALICQWSGDLQQTPTLRASTGLPACSHDAIGYLLPAQGQ